MHSRLTKRAWAGISLALMLSACSTTTASPSPSTTSSQGAGASAAQSNGASGTPASQAVTFWLSTKNAADAADNDRFQAQVLSPFTATTGIQVKIAPQANQTVALQTALSAGGNEPDIVAANGPTQAMQMGASGWLLPLDEFANKYGWTDSFAPWALSLSRVDGVLYSLPDEVETIVLYYNKTLFDQKGWQVPKTFAEMKSLAATVKAAGLIPFAHGNADYRPANGFWLDAFLSAVAGPSKIRAALSGEVKWNDPAIVKAIDELTAFQQNGWFSGSLDNYYSTGQDEMVSNLVTGKAAMEITGTWAIPDFLNGFKGSGNDWDWVPVPSSDGSAVFPLGIGSALAINKNGLAPDASGQFLNYIFSPTVVAGRVLTGRSPAPITNLSPEALAGLDARQLKIIQDLNAASSSSIGFTTYTSWGPKSKDYMETEIEKVWAGDETADEYLTGLQVIFDKELAAGELPPLP
jgi:raffinose/stachyose/melibiose transport system substrate-binding protein